jgi:uncharacterized protein (TIGR01619 family)
VSDISGDEWDFYFTGIDGSPGSIFVNLSIAERAPIQGFGTAFFLSLKMRLPRSEDGLSSQEEFDRLQEIEEALEAELQVEGAAIYVGRVTHDGLRDFFFYTADGALTATRAAAAMRAFAEYSFDVGVRDDPAWLVYLDYLAPSALNREWIENRKVCDALKERGDALTKPREVDHWAYFPSASARDAFVEKTLAAGFSLRSASENDRSTSAGNRFVAQLYRSTVPEAGDMTEATLALSELAAEFGGEYDGWESPVVGGDVDTLH